MKKPKTFVELSKKMEVISENAKGQLKGGFATFSGDGRQPEGTNNCDCLNSGCSNTKCGNTSCSNKNEGDGCACHREISK